MGFFKNFALFSIDILGANIVPVEFNGHLGE